MKIAVLAHSFPRFAGDTHGPFVQDLSEALARHGHEMHVLVPFDVELVLEREGPLNVHSFRYIWPPSWHLLGYSRTLARDVKLRQWAYLQAPFYFFFAARALERLVRNEGIDLVHAHWILPNGFVASRVRRATGVPYCVTLHGSDIFMAERNFLFARMARAALAGAAHVTSCSADLEERLVALAGGDPEGKVKLVANGTDVVPLAADTRAVREAYGLAAEDRLVVAVGRLVDKKGFRFLLEATPGILAEEPRARIVIGGEGDLEQDLRRRARELGIAERVTFTGGLSHPQVLDLIAAGDVFVMPSVRDPRGNIDGLPIVVLEAMAAGRAIVATSVAGMPLAIEHDCSGVLVEERNPTALAEAVSALLADSDRARQLGDAARLRVEESLNWDAIAAVHDELYRAAAT